MGEAVEAQRLSSVLRLSAQRQNQDSTPGGQAPELGAENHHPDVLLVATAAVRGPYLKAAPSLPPLETPPPLFISPFPAQFSC